MDSKLNEDKQEPVSEKESVRGKLEYYQELISRKERRKRDEEELEI